MAIYCTVYSCKEHIHYDEEIRYCMDGSGYFDVRDRNDKWIRVALEKGEYTIDSHQIVRIISMLCDYLLVNLYGHLIIELILLLKTISHVFDTRVNFINPRGPVV